MFLHYPTLHKTETRLDELKPRLIDTWDRIPHEIIDEATVRAKGHH